VSEVRAPLPSPTTAASTATRRWMAPLLVLGVLGCVGLPRRVDPSPTDQVEQRPQDQPGWVMNRTQQHQAAFEIEPAVRTITSALYLDPQTGFSHQLLAQTLVYGMALPDETVAVYRHLAETQPDRPIRRVHAALAALDRHRDDRFVGPTLPWFTEAVASVESIAQDADAPVRARYEARIAGRNLMFLVKDSERARVQGLAAHALLPERLQGRITRLAAAVHDRDAPMATEVCLDILRTDPWAVEACSMLWGLAHSKDADVAAGGETARVTVQEAVEGLHERALADPVLANEIYKFYDRTKQQPRAAALTEAVRAAGGDFVFRDAARWYRRGPFERPKYIDLLQSTNRALGLPSSAQRLARLHEIASMLPSPLEPDSAVTRYFRALLKTARDLGEQADDDELEALEALCAHDDAVRNCLELVEALEARPEAPDPTRMVELLGRSLERLEGELAWLPEPRARRRTTFDRWATQRREELELLRSAEARWIAQGQPELEPFSAPLVDAWPAAGDAQGWLALARMEGDAVPTTLALHADLQALSLLDEAGRAAIAKNDRLTAEARFNLWFPMVALAEAPLWPAVLAAADARRDARDAGLPDGAHPFVGRPAPPLSVTDLAGQPIDLAALRGRVVLVDFWATWCGPCITELPALQELVETLQGEPVTLLALSTDEEVGVVAPFVEARGFTFDVAWIGESGTKQDWAVRGIPSLFVIGPDGTVRYHHQGYREGDEKALIGEVQSLLP
jgi:thiol-disulfide isomerase/thioredoxin